MKTTATTTTNRSNGHRGWRAPGPAVPAAIRGEAMLPRLATLPPEAVLRELGHPNLADVLAPILAAATSGRPVAAIS